MALETILTATFKHETNTFSPAVTDRDAFKARWEYFGDEIPPNFRDTNTPMGGFMERAEAAGVDLIYTVAANARPGGRVTADAYEFYSGQILDTVADHRDQLDGVFLSLHGAMVPEGKDDGEGPLLSAVRDIVGPNLPIVATLDPHSNFTDEMTEAADVLLSYETYPHVDNGDRGRQAFDQLAAVAAGDLDPVWSVERPPLLPDFPRMNTRDGPMADVMARARELEERPGVVKVNVILGFNHADTPITGMAVGTITDGDPDLADEISREVGEYIWSRVTEFVDDYPEPTEAVARAQEHVDARDPDDGPVLLIDVGDNPGGGGVEDRTEMLRELLDAGVDDAGIAVVWDPASVQTCIDAGVGERVSLTLGHHTDDPNFPGEPLEIEGYVKMLTDGEFVNQGPKDTGVRQFLGRAARLDCGEDDDISVIVTERRLSPNDAEVWRHVGITPEQHPLLVLKTVNHFRADYEPFASEIIIVDSPGSFAIDVSQFAYERLTRPVYPLVDVAEIDYPAG